MPATAKPKHTARAPGRPPATDRAAPTAGSRAPAHAGQPRTGHLDLPLIGTIAFPPRQQLIFLAGVGALAVTGVIEWPVAATVALGHLLATSHSNETVRELGEALEQA